MWDRSTGAPLGPGIGWQDLRTVGECIRARQDGLQPAPNQTVTKAAWLLQHHLEGRRPDEVCIGTVDSWLVWTLTGGAAHVTDHSNAAVTGLCGPDDVRWNRRVLDAFGIPAEALPTIVPSSGVVMDAVSLTGAPPIGAIVGDQQASMIGQGCVEPGRRQDHVRHRRHARHVSRRRTARHCPAERPRHVPDRRVVPRRRDHVRGRGDHAVGGRVHRVAARPRPGRVGRGDERRRGDGRVSRRRHVRARAAPASVRPTGTSEPPGRSPV